MKHSASKLIAGHREAAAARPLSVELRFCISPMAFLILSIVTALPASFEKQIPELATITSKMATPMKTEAAGPVFDINEKALVRRIDYRIVPLMFFCYLMQFLDKVLINVSSIHL